MNSILQFINLYKPPSQSIRKVLPNVHTYIQSMSSGYILNLIYVLVLKDLMIVFTHFQMISNTRQDRTQETGIEREKCQDANNMKCIFVCIIHTHTHTRICLCIYNCQMIICLIQIAHTHAHTFTFSQELTFICKQSLMQRKGNEKKNKETQQLVTITRNRLGGQDGN